MDKLQEAQFLILEYYNDQIEKDNWLDKRLLKANDLIQEYRKQKESQIEYDYNWYPIE